MNKVKLGELLTVKHGYAFKSENYVEKSEFALVTLANISATNNFQFAPEKTTYYGVDFPKDFILKTDDLIMPLTEQVIGLFGNTAFVPDMDDISFVLNQRVGKITPIEGRADKYYLHYLLATNLVKDQLEYRASGTRQRNISPSDIYDVEVYIPDIETQRKIGETLYKLEKKINTNNKINDNLYQQSSFLFSYWFKQFDFPNNHGKPYRSSGGKMIWNNDLKMEIPENWRCAKLRDIVAVKGDTISDTDAVSELYYSPIDVIPKKTLSFAGGLPSEEANSSLQLYEEDDILLGAMRVYFHRVCIASQRGITRSTTMVLKPIERDLLCFAYQVINDEKTIQYATQNSSGTQQPYINWLGGLENYRFAMPNEEDIVKEFSLMLLPIIRKAQQLEKENLELTKIRDWLLPMLMNGQVIIAN